MRQKQPPKDAGSRFCIHKARQRCTSRRFDLFRIDRVTQGTIRRMTLDVKTTFIAELPSTVSKAAKALQCADQSQTRPATRSIAVFAYSRLCLSQWQRQIKSAGWANGGEIE